MIENTRVKSPEHSAQLIAERFESAKKRGVPMFLASDEGNGLQINGYNWSDELVANLICFFYEKNHDLVVDVVFSNMAKDAMDKNGTVN